MFENIGQNLDLIFESEANSKEIRELSLQMDTFYAVSSAIEVGLFQSLCMPKSPKELSESLGLHPVITNKLCKALASRGYLAKEGDHYAISDLTRTFLVVSSPFFQGHLIKLIKSLRESRWSNLSKILKEGPRDPSPTHQFDEEFSLAMAEGAIGGALQRTLKFMREIPEFKNAKRCLDLGGGHGLYSLAFIRANPQLQAFIFDLPPVIEGITKKFVANSNRITTMEGDFNKDDLGQGFDIVFASDVLYRNEDALLPILDKIWSSLNPEGILVTKHYHIDKLLEDSAAVLSDLMFSMSFAGSEIYSTDDFIRLLKSSGFSPARMEDISSSVSCSKIIMAKKVLD